MRGDEGNRLRHSNIRGTHMIPRVNQAVILLFVAMSGCTTITPSLEQSIVSHPEVFSHKHFDRALHQTVDDRGRVDYKALKNHPDDLEAYYQLVSRYSPDSHPKLFLSEQDKLAYWINAYNAAVIKIVLTYYPITGIEDVTPPVPFFFLPDKTGFFIFQRPTFGSETTSLYYLENSVIRERFSEPRVHFALNCASLGCPRLPNSAFTGDQLHAQLEHEARRFFAEERNLKIDPELKIIYMSSIMDWYQNDFVDWYQARYPDAKATLIDYVALYIPKEKAEHLKAIAPNYTVEFISYDWNLNDQNTTN